MNSEESERILTPPIIRTHVCRLAGRRQIQFGDGFRCLLTNEWRRRGDWGGGIPTCASRKVKLRGIPKSQVMKLYRIMSQKFVWRDIFISTSVWHNRRIDRRPVCDSREKLAEENIPPPKSRYRGTRVWRRCRQRGKLFSYIQCVVYVCVCTCYSRDQFGPRVPAPN